MTDVDQLADFIRTATREEAVVEVMRDRYVERLEAKSGNIDPLVTVMKRGDWRFKLLKQTGLSDKYKLTCVRRKDDAD
jgi:hypothetical protein